MIDPDLPAPGMRVRMTGAGTVLTVGERLGEGGQGVVHRALLPSGAAFALKWYRASSDTPEQRQAIAALIAHGCPHRAFLWPIDLVTAPELPGFGYVMPLREPRFISFAQMLSEPTQPSFRVLANIGRDLVEAFAALHFGGLCYRDVSFGNLFVDPERAEVAICDNDNVGTDRGHVAVYGTLRFMAPEIVRLEQLPSTVTDLHSLAVLLFYLFVHGHPLDGCRVQGSYTWGEDGHVSENDLAFTHYGTSPLFVFHPDDGSNRPVPGDLMLTWWSIYPRFLRDLFTRAFTTGLTDASLSGRITEGVWRKALLRLHDSVSVCPTCSAARFYDPDEPDAPCWSCHNPAPPPPTLELASSSIVLSEGATVTAHHLRRNRDYQTIEAVVEPHPRDPAAVVLRNRSTVTWTVSPEGEPTDQVLPGQRLAVRPMTIAFGPATGVVRAPSRRAHITRIWRQAVPPPTSPPRAATAPAWRQAAPPVIPPPATPPRD